MWHEHIFVCTKILHLSKHSSYSTYLMLLRVSSTQIDHVWNENHILDFMHDCTHNHVHIFAIAFHIHIHIGAAPYSYSYLNSLCIESQSHFHIHIHENIPYSSIFIFTMMSHIHTHVLIPLTTFQLICWYIQIKDEFTFSVCFAPWGWPFQCHGVLFPVCSHSWYLVLSYQPFWCNQVLRIIIPEDLVE